MAAKSHSKAHTSPTGAPTTVLVNTCGMSPSSVMIACDAGLAATEAYVAGPYRHKSAARCQWHRRTVCGLVSGRARFVAAGSGTTRTDPQCAAARCQWRMFTARATTSAMAATETADCNIIIIFAQRVRGMTSLAAKEMAFVNDRWR